jgi:hypothetical protein
MIFLKNNFERYIKNCLLKKTILKQLLNIQVVTHPKKEEKEKEQSRIS